tara:strand:+ start:158 stop:490 length:333 start_codon:yes stop_codon:yes gene_type:complete
MLDMSWHPWYDACKARESASNPPQIDLTMQPITATLIKPTIAPSMNYLAIGDDVYFMQNGSLHCRSEGQTFEVSDDDMDDDTLEYYAHLQYYMSQIEALTQEYTTTIFTK